MSSMVAQPDQRGGSACCAAPGQAVHAQRSAPEPGNRRGVTPRNRTAWVAGSQAGLAARRIPDGSHPPGGLREDRESTSGLRESEANHEHVQGSSPSANQSLLCGPADDARGVRCPYQFRRTISLRARSRSMVVAAPLARPSVTRTGNWNSSSGNTRSRHPLGAALDSQTLAEHEIQSGDKPAAPGPGDLGRAGAGSRPRGGHPYNRHRVRLEGAEKEAAEVM